MTTFTITASPNTDIWRKPPHTDRFNAPTASPPGTPTSSSISSAPLSTFLSARASFSAAWREHYDQGGILLTFSHPGTTQATSASPPKWIKAGIEYYNGNPMVSIVSCDRFADWSIAEPAGRDEWTTISIEKEKDGHGWSLWVYQVLEGGTKIPLREICWVYGDAVGETPAIDWQLEVTAMAARPEKKVTDALEVKVRDMEVRWGEPGSPYL